jgi:hypothetical protein
MRSAIALHAGNRSVRMLRPDIADVLAFLDNPE